MRNIDIEKILEPWKGSVIQGAIQIHKRIMEKGVTWDDVEKWIKKNPRVITSEMSVEGRKIRKETKIKTCPRCGKPMNGSNLYAESVKYKEGFRSYWLCGAACCSGKGCGYEEWSKLTIEEWKLKLSKKEGN